MEKVCCEATKMDFSSNFFVSLFLDVILHLLLWLSAHFNKLYDQSNDCIIFV